jgi:hypothetical protein
LRRAFDLDVRLYDLDPREPFASLHGIARHDARERLPVRADWVFLDPPYFGTSDALYAGEMAATKDPDRYLALLRAVVGAMADSLNPGGVLCVCLPRYVPGRPGAARHTLTPYPTSPSDRARIPGLILPFATLG